MVRGALNMLVLSWFVHPPSLDQSFGGSWASLQALVGSHLPTGAASARILTRLARSVDRFATPKTSCVATTSDGPTNPVPGRSSGEKREKTTAA
jgi:hypothetical protein